MRRLSDREWVGHCTVDMSEELQRLATGGVFQSSPDAGIAAVGVSYVTLLQVRFPLKIATSSEPQL